MRWSIIRVIWMRELRDQLRDRRTIFMIAVLPIILYPLGGLGMMQLAGGAAKAPVVGVRGVENLPRAAPAAAVGWLTLTPCPANPLAGVERATAAAALDLAHEDDPGEAFPPLLIEGSGPGGWRIAPAYLERPDDRRSLGILSLPADAAAAPRGPLDDRSADLVVTVPPDFLLRLRDGENPALTILGRDGDDLSRAADGRFTAALLRWRQAVQQVRLARLGLPRDFDEPFHVERPRRDPEQDATDLFALLLRMFPFILVLWSLAGALYPAVDLCAGEKERGTMETLLISPASREEIVYGKFLTIWVFSAATALLNLVSMGLTVWTLSSRLPNNAFSPTVLFWSVLLVLPLSAFFSAVCLAVGAYARSSKEGQYYLMPLFLLTLPLIFLTLAPGVDLNPLYSMVPVTGVALLLQRLILPDAQPDRAWMTWLYFLPVLAPMVIYSWLALRWAIAQFQREEVLFREAERLDVGLWLRRLFREKEALPTVGQAFFCFGLLMVLRWLSLGFGRDRSMLDVTAVCQLAFTAAPPLFMAVILTTRPLQGLALRLPPWWSWPAAALLAVLCVPPLAWLTMLVLDQFPALKQLLQEYAPLAGTLQSDAGRSPAFLILLAVLPALCEELAFRGFLLTGLRRRFRPWAAVLLSSFLYALFQMNVFQFATAFVLGVVLALVALRSGSVGPAIVFHLVYNLSTLFASQALSDPLLGAGAAVGCAAAAAGLLTAMLVLGKRPTAAPGPEQAGPPTAAAANRAAATDAVRQAPS